MASSLARRNICIILLSFLYIFHAVNNIIVVEADLTPINTDSMIYFKQSIQCFRALFEDKIKFFEIVKTSFYNAAKPPVFSLSIIPFYLIFGIKPDVACLMPNLIFLAVVIAAIFFIGRYFFNDYAGVVSAFILTTYPLVFGLSRWCLASFASLAMVCLTVLFLIKTEGFSNRKYSLLSGIAAALAALTHFTSLFSLIVPYGFFFSEGLRASGENREGKLKRQGKYLNLFLSISFMACFVLAWWFLANSAVIKKLSVNRNLPSFKIIPAGIVYFCRTLLAVQLHWFYALLFVTAGTFLAFKRTRIFLFLCAWYVLHTLLISCFPSSWTARFNVAPLSAIALISSLGIFSIPWKWVKVLFVTAVFAFGIFQYCIISYYPLAGDYYREMIPLDKKHRLVQDEQVNHQGLLQANKTYWNQNEIISLLLEGKDKNDPTEVVAWIIYGKAAIHGALFTRVIAEKLPIRIENPAADGWPAEGSYNERDIEREIIAADYVLSYEERVFDCGREHRLIEKVRSVFCRNLNNFREIKKFKMPDGNIMFIYKNKRSFSSGAEHYGTEHGIEMQEERESDEKEGHAEKQSVDPEGNGSEYDAKPIAQDIYQTIRDYIMQKSKQSGTLDIFDPEAGEAGGILKLSLLRIHEKVRQAGEYYYACAYFEDIDRGNWLDLDFSVQDKNGNLVVANVTIHKISGVER